MSKTISIIFFGSGPVAAASLELLHEQFTIEAVITKPKPEGHRGDYPTLEVAKRLGLTIYTPTNKKELSELFATHPVRSTVGVVIDYGIIIAQDVIDYFPKGIVNSHFSLLPQWRGADPITFSILSGQQETGVSLMLITAGLDEGPLLGQSELTIEPTDTAATLTEKLITLSDAMLRLILPMWVQNQTAPGDQLEVSILTDNTPSYSRKLTKEDGRLNWNKPAEQLEREIRAFATWPKSYTKFNDLDVVITAAHVSEQKGDAGSLAVQNKELIMYCGEGALVIDKLKPAGKPEMDASGFINGYKKYIS